MTPVEAPTQRDYQEQASTAVEGAFFDAGQNRLLVKKPTGTGKTVWFAGLLKRPRIEEWLKATPSKGAKLLVIAHREELLEQAADKINRQNKGLIVSIEQGDRYANNYSDVVIASIQTLAAVNFRRLRRLMKHHAFRIVIVDEAHHAAAKTYRTVLALLGFLPIADAILSGATNIEAATHDDIAKMEEALRGWDAIAPRDRILIGVTATPNRSDAVGLGCVFQSIAYSYGLKQAIDDGWLVPLVPWVIETTTSLDGVHMARGDFNQRELADAVNNEQRNRLALAAWRAHADGLATIGFSVDVAHAHELARIFVDDGIAAKAISGETPKEDRRIFLRNYTEGTLDVLMNCMVLTEGTDLPRTECILHAKPTSSATLYEQMTGRGLRIHPDDPAGPERLAALLAGARTIKPSCIVIDLVDVARRHSLQAAPVLYGLPPSLVAKGKSLQQLKDEFDEFMAKYPGFDVAGAGRATLEDLRMRASTFDIWEVPELGAFGNGRALDWIKFGPDQYQIQYPWADGTETLTIAPDLLGHFEVVCTLRSNGGPAGIRQRTLAAQVTTADAAAGLAEAFVLQERRSVMKLKDRDAPWRGRPASSGQIGLLKRLRVPFKNGITMGEASSLIDLAKARGGRR